LPRHRQPRGIPEDDVATFFDAVVGDGHVVAVPDADGVAAAGDVEVFAVNLVAIDAAAVRFAQIDAKQRLFKTVTADGDIGGLDDETGILLVERVAAVADQ
jgi:hypothetical protein